MDTGVYAIALCKEGARDHSSAAATASGLSLTPFRGPVQTPVYAAHETRGFHMENTPSGLYFHAHTCRL
jgi:hypothetical protein